MVNRKDMTTSVDVSEILRLAVEVAKLIGAGVKRAVLESKLKWAIEKIQELSAEIANKNKLLVRYSNENRKLKKQLEKKEN